MDVSLSESLVAVARGLAWITAAVVALSLVVALAAGVTRKTEPLTPCERAEAMRGWETVDCDRQREADETAALTAGG